MNILILTILIKFAFASENETCFACQKWSKSHLHVTKFYSSLVYNLVYLEFNTLSQLNISCGLLVDHQINLLGMSSTNSMFLLAQNFDLRPLLSSLTFYYFNSIYIEMHNIKGFSLSPYNSQQTVENNIFSLTFVDSHFDFYLNETLLISKELCVRTNFERTKLNLATKLIFSYVYYSNHVCPYVFMHSPLQEFTFNHITNTV